MKKAILILISLMIIITGCGKQKASAKQSDFLRADFGTKLKSAQKFLDYMDAGDRAYQSGEYQSALDHYKAADEIAHGRSFRTMINEALAKTYEELQDYNNAIYYYQAASESTMNEDRKNYFESESKRVGSLHQNSNL